MDNTATYFEETMWRRALDVPDSGKSKRGPPVNMVMNFRVTNWATTSFWKKKGGLHPT